MTTDKPHVLKVPRSGAVGKKPAKKVKPVPQTSGPAAQATQASPK